MKIIRVFPRRTKYTPTDEYAFVGEPQLWQPEADAVYISVVFTWDVEYAYKLVEAWGAHYPNKVAIGGPAFGDRGAALRGD